jgi:hypothetical protein
MTTTNTMIEGRRADSARRRQRVIKALNDAATRGGEISVSAIARAATVDRTFLYRHKDLLAQIHVAQTNPSPADGSGPVVSRASLQADVANAHGRLARQAAHIRQLERNWLNCSGITPGANPGSVPRPTSTNSSTASPCSNSRSSTSPANSKSGLTNSLRPEPPTGNSSPTSTAETDPQRT